MEVTWERSLRVDEPLWTKPFYMLAALTVAALLLSLYRTFAGLGAVTGLNDGYSWGLFKNFNVTTLTALGSAGYAVGVLVWILNRQKYHVIMRTAALISILSYTSGMIGIGVDVGRPWNIIWVLDPTTWNRYSILLEVLICMTGYLLLGLQTENLPAFVERFLEGRYPETWKKKAETALNFIKRIYPFAIALAFILPSMHQSSLGSLMMLAGPRVHPLWQTSMLPVLYLLMAYILGFAAIVGILMLSCMIYNRPLDMKILSRLGQITGWTALIWLGLRIGDIFGRGMLPAVFAFDSYSLFFLLEMILINIPAFGLLRAKWRNDPGKLYMLMVVLSVGGLLYRYIPTTIAFIPGDRYFYFPTISEMIISGGFIAMAVLGFLYTVKNFNILPVPLSYWYASQPGSVTPKVSK
ncbi:MAG: Ni/Fe-hydrogenase cytochrome b subunit [Bacteroidetes bacterium]|nr:Ni/Fe-hydrogenase cytochrome b subunit [Bacteroidota bacterium]